MDLGLEIVLSNGHEIAMHVALNIAIIVRNWGPKCNGGWPLARWWIRRMCSWLASVWALLQNLFDVIQAAFDGIMPLKGRMLRKRFKQRSGLV